MGLQYAADLINSVELGHWMEKLPPIKAANVPCGMLILPVLSAEIPLFFIRMKICIKVLSCETFGTNWLVEQELSVR